MQSNKKILSLNLDDFKGYTQTQKSAFIFYVTLQCKFNNNIIENPTAERLAELAGVGVSSVYKYIKILQRWGYIKKTKQALLIIQQEKQPEKKFFKVKLYRSLKFNNTKLVLYSLMTEIHINQQIHNELGSKKQSKRLRQTSKDEIQAKAGDKVFISTRSVAKVLGISHQSVNSFLKKAKEKGIIDYKFNYKLIAKDIERSQIKDYAFNINRYSNSFKYFRYSGGNMYLHCGLIFNSLLSLSM